jgi:hypothetical protein
MPQDEGIHVVFQLVKIVRHGWHNDTPLGNQVRPGGARSGL